MKKKLFITVFALLLTAAVFAQQTYSIGDTGPAGGTVFYNKGIPSDGWQYLEFAPQQYEFLAPWGQVGRDISGTRLEIGTGKRNTQLIAEWPTEPAGAAQQCASLNINGFIDWFLPSREELTLIYIFYEQSGFVGFRNAEYWSSSQSTLNQAWLQRFSDGTRMNSHDSFPSKNYILYVRAIRQF
jgi:hypothetical protein